MEEFILMRRVLSIVVILTLLTGCGVDLSFETYAEEVTENSDVYESIDEMIGYVEFDDAKVGLSLVNTYDGAEVLVLHQLYIDESTSFSATVHGEHVPLGYSISNKENVWYEASLNSDEFYYAEDKTNEHLYAVGILNGDVKDIKYEDSVVKYKNYKFNYLSNTVEVTLWLAQLNTDQKFDIENLNY